MYAVRNLKYHILPTVQMNSPFIFAKDLFFAHPNNFNHFVKNIIKTPINMVVQEEMIIPCAA
jgi:hypothetical protein